MIQWLNQRRGQSTLEYAVLVVIIVAALLSIQVYIKRGVQGKLKSSADEIGDQYSDGNVNSVKATNTVSRTRDTFGNIAGVADSGQGISQSKLVGDEKTNTEERTVILNDTQEYWGNK